MQRRQLDSGVSTDHFEPTTHPSVPPSFLFRPVSPIDLSTKGRRHGNKDSNSRRDPRDVCWRSPEDPRHERLRRLVNRRLPDIGRRERGKRRLQVEWAADKGYGTVRTTTNNFGRWCAIKQGDIFQPPHEAVAGILKHLRRPVEPDPRFKVDDFNILDPCAGEAKALVQLAEGLGVSKDHVFAIELNARRAARIAEAYTDVRLLGPCSFEATSITRRSFSMVYLNPPLDDEFGGGGREEVKFLRPAVAPRVGRLPRSKAWPSFEQIPWFCTTCPESRDRPRPIRCRR